MTVYLKAAKAGIQCRKDSKCDPKPDQINEFNLHSNKEREKVRARNEYQIGSLIKLTYDVSFPLFRFLRRSKKKEENKVRF